MIDTVILELGGVLIDWSPRYPPRALPGATRMVGPATGAEGRGSCPGA